MNRVKNIYLNSGISFIRFTLDKLQGTVSLRSFDDSIPLPLLRKHFCNVLYLFISEQSSV